MADGVTFPLTGAGDSTAKAATDDTGATGHAQIIKLAISTDGSVSLIPATTTDGILVNLGTNNDVTVTGTVTATPTGTQNVDVTANTIGLATSAKQDTIIGHVDGLETLVTSTNTKLDTANTSLGLLDNAISGNEMQVDVVAALPAGTNNIGDVDVLSLPALPAGTNAIGKLSANSGVDIGDVDVTSSVSSTLDHGSNLDIDTTAEQITSTSFAAKFGVTVKSAVDNTATVYIGNSDVTDGDTAATDGFPLEPGESITLPVTNSNLLYAIAASANQKVFWIGV